MDFEFTEELGMLQDMAYKFAQNEFSPMSHECDVEEKYTPEIFKKAAENGLVGAWVPEEYGGAGAGMLGLCVITEQLSRVDMGIGLNIVAATFGCEAIYFYGSEEQKKQWITPVCQGEMVSAGAFTEPDAGTDAAGYRTRAVKDGSDYIINGSKMFITNGTVAGFFRHPVHYRPGSQAAQQIQPDNHPGRPARHHHDQDQGKNGYPSQ
jgi:acyl-CoA dehydrogenase